MARFNWKAALGGITKTAAYFFPNDVTFLRATQSQSATGAVLRTSWAPVVGLTSVPALIQQPQLNESLAGGGDVIIHSGQVNITLPFFTTALDTDMRVHDEAGVEYDVTGWDYDPAKVTTTVRAEYRNPKGENR